MASEKNQENLFDRPYADPDHPGNALRPRVRCLGCGKLGCTTAWGKWCYGCNVERMDRLNRQFREIAKSYGIEVE